MEVIKQADNKLLHRKELVLVVESDSTPTNNELLEEIAEKFKAKKEAIVIVYIKGKFGTNKFEVFVKIYDNIESREKYEVITRKARKKGVEEKKKADEEVKKSRAEEKVKAEEAKKAAEEKPAEEQTEHPKETPAEVQQEANPEQEPKQKLKPEDSQPEEEL